MKTLYLECGMGAAGDMLAAALSELVDQKAFEEKMNHLGLADVSYEITKTKKCGIEGSHVSVKVNGEEEDEHMHEHHHDHEHEHHHHEEEHCHSHDEEEHEHHHHHSSLHDIEDIVNALDVSDRVKKDVMNVYRIIAEAEAHVHQSDIDNIHFHEVGTKDAVADITAVCILMEEIGAKRIVCSPVALGNGTVRCAHGILPVPAPATAYILQGIPAYAGKENGELCTPTGAALLKYFVDSFENMPVMVTEKIGYGMGKKDFSTANCVRAFLGETKEDGSVTELVCSIDDMTPEDIGFAAERLFEAGALDVYTTPIYMKKNRPGVLLTVMCRMSDRERMVEEVFKHTSTLGIREYVSRRYSLNRKIDTIETEFGPVRIKKCSGYGRESSKLEYDDLAEIARSGNLSILEVRRKIGK